MFSVDHTPTVRSGPSTSPLSLFSSVWAPLGVCGWQRSGVNCDTADLMSARPRPPRVTSAIHRKWPVSDGGCCWPIMRALKLSGYLCRPRRRWQPRAATHTYKDTTETLTADRQTERRRLHQSLIMSYLWHSLFTSSQLKQKYAALNSKTHILFLYFRFFSEQTHTHTHTQISCKMSAGKKPSLRPVLTFRYPFTSSPFFTTICANQDKRMKQTMNIHFLRSSKWYSMWTWQNWIHVCSE